MTGLPVYFNMISHLAAAQAGLRMSAEANTPSSLGWQHAF